MTEMAEDDAEALEEEEKEEIGIGIEKDKIAAPKRKRWDTAGSSG